MRSFSVLFILVFPFLLQAQIVNIEKLRTEADDEKKLALEIELGFGVAKNSAGRQLDGSAALRLDYLFKEKNKFLLLGDYGFSRVAIDEGETTDLDNHSFLHFRYTREITPLLHWEAFTQTQANRVENVDLRFLLGSGPRFKIIRKKNAYLHLGTTYMYEFMREEIGETGSFYTLKHHRLSSYVSAVVKLKSGAALSHVTYYQPRFDEWSDFRVSSETGISFTLWKKLKWKSYFSLVYDSLPPVGATELRYQFTNGLAFSL